MTAPETAASHPGSPSLGGSEVGVEVDAAVDDATSLDARTSTTVESDDGRTFMLRSAPADVQVGDLVDIRTQAGSLLGWVETRDRDGEKRWRQGRC